MTELVAVYSNNATSTLAGSISDVATTCALSAGTGVKFPNPGSGQYFSLTFISASNSNILEIVYVTARSGDTITTMLRGQEGTSALAWSAGDLAKHLVTAGDLNGFQQGVNSRIRLNAPVTIYANISSGNDANDGLTPGTAVEHLQIAILIALANYDAAGGQQITIQLADGVYAATNASVGIIAGAIPGSAGTQSLVIQGNVVTPANVTLNATNGSCIIAESAAMVKLSGMTLTASGSGALQGFGILASVDAVVTVGAVANDIVFDSCAVGHIFSGGDAQVFGLVDYVITGGAANHYHATAQGQINIQGVTVTITGSPAFATFAAADAQGMIYAPGNTYSGAATATDQYTVDGLAYIFTNGAGSGYFPGTTAPAGTHGGVYN